MADGTATADLGPEPGSARRDWRYILALSGALLLVLSYFLPMFTNRIAAATVTFSGETVRAQQYPVLIHGEFYAQAAHPLKEELANVSVKVTPVDEHAASAWGWLFAVAHDRQTLGTLLSYFFSLLAPLLAAIAVLVFWVLSVRGDARRYTGLIPLNINLAGVGLLAVLLIWFHQYDFNASLLPLTGGALAPRLGYWGIALGALAQFVALLAMSRLTLRHAASWWLLVGVVAPLTEKDVQHLLRDTKASRLLDGFRGRPPADRDALQNLILKISRLMVEVEDVEELDLNPVIVHEAGKGLTVVDARVILKNR